MSLRSLSLSLSLSLLVLVGCPASGGGDDDDSAADGSCSVIDSGAYTMIGDAWGMAMSATVTVDMGACAFTFSGWNMAMSVPDGGTIDGDTVTLSGGSYWNTCTGTVTSSTTVSGTCASDGASWGFEPGA